jgi:hypothetical protein
MTTTYNTKALCQDRQLPAAENQNIWGNVRASRYGDLITAPLGSKVYGYADEGSYFLVTNPTMGTGIAGIAASTSFDAAEHLMLIRNTNTSKRLYLDFIDLVVTAAGASGTTTGFTMTADKGTSRYTSGGSTLTPVNPNIDDTASAADVLVKFGALVTTAASADVRPLGDFLVRTVIKVVGDSYRFTFGDSGAAWQCAGASLDGTTSAKVTIPCPPVILGETDQFLLSDWAASQSGASSYQVRCGFWLR